MRKLKFFVLFVFAGFLSFSQTSRINTVFLSKEKSVYDSIVRYSINSTINLVDTANIHSFEVKIKGVASDSVYFVGTYQIPQTESVFVNGVLRDKLMLFVYVGEFILTEPIYMLTAIVNSDNSKDSPIITNE